MRHFKIFLLVLGMVLCYSTMNAQSIIVDDSKTAQELVTNILINSSCINVQSVSATGNPQTGAQSYAYFSSGTSNFPFPSGIVLSTGPSKNTEGPFVQSTSIGVKNDSWQGDNDLNRALNIAESKQATVLEFDFVPLTNTISFDYIFASNEYQSYFPCIYSDGFAFLIKKAGTSEEYKNLAVLPRTTIPVSATTVHPKIESVTVNNRTYDGCDPLNVNYYNGNNTISSPINFAGQTVVMNVETEVEANVTYHLKLVIADDKTGQYNSAVFIDAGSFLSKIKFGEDKTAANGNPACYGESVLLDTQLNNTSNTFKWFKKDNANNYTLIPSATNSTYSAQDEGTYKVEVMLNGTTCVSTGELKIEYAPDFSVSNAAIFQCDEDADGYTIFNLNKVNNIIKNNASQFVNSGYYESLTDAQSKTNPISNPEQYKNKAANQIVFGRVENSFGCFKVAEVTLQISNTSIPAQNPIATCDGDENQDGLYQFDLNSEVSPQILSGLPPSLTLNYFLTANEAVTETNPLPNIFSNTTPYSQIIYARAINGSDCYGITPITLIVNTFDPPNFENETQYLCKGDEINLTVNTGFNGYLWSTGDTSNSIKITTAGDYSITVKDVNGCEKTKNFKIVASEPATITGTVVKDFSANENTVSVEYTGIGNYEFSLDGTFFQDEPLFTRVSPGIYNAIARDKNGCGFSNSYLFYVIDYPRYFTPNDDGYNDTWFIQNLDQLPKCTISIFDRYGKFLKEMDPNANGWTGRFNGQPLPADDYWFTIAFVDGRVVKGHFSLKR
ncbi:T9SS type B sorting domain-containing protein [Flavobacterium hercynium]|uniref:T9SS type B sorting domain-containing protein n=1 Tax=Flavobacterium hercynium TaxID=387094 RepID=A0A226HFN2_9FLAO|nr:choice-of-anchor L domain-containing protein [Flavobacterium hercynium]OXA93077.1 hypothetical protein B0A66_07300 [Flavobacterium hercynium]SMP32374.1 gliding motility-associated C-terminal domain-containing protein [Flavobacterium hercynium]